MSERSKCPGKKKSGESCGSEIGDGDFCSRCGFDYSLLWENQGQIKEDSHKSEVSKDEPNVFHIDHSKDPGSGHCKAPGKEEVNNSAGNAALSDKKEKPIDKTEGKPEECTVTRNEEKEKQSMEKEEKIRKGAVHDKETLEKSPKLSVESGGEHHLAPSHEEKNKKDDENEKLHDKCVGDGKVTTPEEINEKADVQFDKKLVPSDTKKKENEDDKGAGDNQESTPEETKKAESPLKESGNKIMNQSEETKKEKKDSSHSMDTGGNKVTPPEENSEKADVQLDNKSGDKKLAQSDTKTKEDKEVGHDKGADDTQKSAPKETKKAEIQLKESGNKSFNQIDEAKKGKKDDSHSKVDDAVASRKENDPKDTSKSPEGGSIKTDKNLLNISNQGKTSDGSKGNVGKTPGSAQKPVVPDKKNVKPKDRFTVKFYVVFPLREFGFGTWNEDLVKLEIDQLFKTCSPSDKCMVVDKEIDCGILLLMQEVVFPKEKLIDKHISYKYVIKNDGANKPEDCYPKQRKLQCSREMLETSEWNQYDCFDPKKGHLSIGKKALKLFTKLLVGKSASDVSKEDFISSQYYHLFPKWRELKINGKEGLGETYLKKFDAVYHCAKSALKELGMDVSHLEKLTKIGMQEYINKDSNEAETLARICCVLHILMKYKLFEGNMSASICQKLLIDSGAQNYEFFCEAFPSESVRKEIAQVLISFLKEIVKYGFIDPSWLLVIPFLHFLNSKVKPFQPLKIDKLHADDKWWGVEDISKLVDIHKECISDRQNLVKKMCSNRLEALFEVDRLLPRSVLSVMNLRDIPELLKTGKFPLDACLANVIYFAKTSFTHDELLRDKIEECLFEINSLIEKFFLLNNEFQDIEQLDDANCKRLWDKMEYYCGLVLELFDVVVNKFTFVNIIFCSVTIVISMLNAAYEFHGKSSSKFKKNSEVYEKILKSLFYGVIEKLKSILHNLPYSWTTENKLMICSQLLAYNIKDNKCANDWKDFIKSFLLKTIEQLFASERFKLFSACDKSHHPLIGTWINEKIFSEVEEALQYNRLSYLELLFDKSNSSYKNIYEMIVHRIWPPNDDDVGMLSFILTQSLLPKIIKLFYEKNAGEFIDEHCQTKFFRAVSFFESTHESLMIGNIKVGTLKQILSNSEKFLAISNLICKTEKKTVEETLNVRKKEIEYYGERQKEVRVTLEFCRGIASEEIRKLEKEMQVNVDEVNLSDICEPSNCITQQTKLKVFNVNSETLEMINFLKKNKESIILENTWQHFMCAHQHNKDLTIADIINKIFKPTEKTWNDLVESLKKGDISLNEIDTKFGSFKDNYTNLLNELKKICGNFVAMKRLQQIKNYHQLKKYKKGAKTMLNLKSKFELTGDFSNVETVADMENTQNMWLDSVSDELVNEFKILENVDDTKIKCLDVFIKEKKFVDWMKSSLSGPREVKVLVDLALISAAGQGDMEVERVSCLHAAATAYSPLIYDLKQEMGFQEFFPLCQSVWNVADNDEHIATKFKDSARQLDWLIRLKESHGSVEVSALDSASNINAKGIFTIGNLPDRQNSALTLDNVVRLKIHLKKGERDMGDEIHDKLEEEKWKEYNIKQLCDLQSKLMLVAGKAHEGKEGVDDFIRMFDGVLRLANVYIQLVNAGCCLFKFWHVNFFCDSAKPVFAKIFVGSDDQAKCLTGTRNTRSSFKIQEKIENLCDFMEACLKDWMDYIQNKRNKRYFLNYYTTKQIVILQNEMAKLMNNDATCSVQELLQFLSLIKNKCSMDEVQVVLMESYEELEQENVPDTSVIPDDKTAPNCSTGDDKELQNEFVQSLLKSGFSLSLARAAEKKKQTDNMEDAILWCMENETNDEFKSDEEEVTENENISDEKETKKLLLMDKESLHSTVNEFISSQTKQNLHLEEEFSKVWKMFLKNIDSDFCEYLSIEHLGLFLEKLAAMSASTKPHRDLPHHIKKGRPNLILCNQTEIWPTVLSLFDASSNLPFPKVDEILICNEDTTAEEVELLWLRAKGDKGGKIYCLVHADLLDYDVAVTAEKSLNIHCSDEKDLQLIIICSSESSGRSHITNIFDQYRVKCSPIDSASICKYIKNHLTVSNDSESASHLDPERCCVRLIKSHQAGAGKTLKVKRLASELVKFSENSCHENVFLTVSLNSQKVDTSAVVKSLRSFVKEKQEEEMRIFHFDVSSEVIEGLDYLFFNLLILGSIKDSDGYVWTRCKNDLYLIESMPLLKKTTVKSTTLTESEKNSPRYLHEIFYLLPTLTCWSPKDSLSILTNRNVSENHINAELKRLDQTMDMNEFESVSFRRPYLYLRALSRNEPVDQVSLKQIVGDVKECITVLTRFCGVDNPSWSELKHFVDFLNFQLAACENSVFCQDYLAPDLPGFLKFVLTFMLQMSQDFATRSLKISEESPEALTNLTDLLSEDRLLEGYEMKRKWETSSHPFLFFNADGHSFTFMGFVVDPRTGNVVNPVTNAILIQNVVPQNLFTALQRNKVNLSENFDNLARLDKLAKMGTIMGMDFIHDPDDSYELTADNVKKMLAIYMRFRCNIPVIIMGETGCGKTRLVKFLCDFMKPPGADIENMLLMKVHGGTTSHNIIDKIKKASKVAEDNAQEFSGLETVLFFDEANTTEAIGMIKEVMCDITINGKPFHANHLKLVAACNPYRKHSQQVIVQLEKAGLGYHVSAKQTNDRLGRIPMRQLVYRVRPLPPSMIPLVWDFGQLNAEVEKLYINQMVHRHIIHNMKLDVPDSNLRIVSDILAASQQFMRTQVDECSFVSLRDVARCLKVLGWFYEHRRIFVEMDKLMTPTGVEKRLKEEEEEEEEDAGADLVIQLHRDDLSRSLILALGVCYHACLNKRKEYREFISKFVEKLCTLQHGPDTILEEISKCQDVFLNEIEIGENIARNQALKENFFMMVVCIELRIPLFLVGKPGSSKSLAKTIVADAMQGNQARTKLFRGFKSVHIVSYQCSPLSTPEGIVGTFRQCAKLQEGKDLTKFVSVVVLDEVGLAEDSERMPLKTLHPLLEDGCEGDDEPKPHKKVAFIGISNWSLDPAKMNRGIFVQRGLPDEEELVTSAKGICSSDEIVFKRCEKLLDPLAKGYLELYNSALEIREFFGLRDFYSLIKMVFCKSKMVDRTPTWTELKYAIMRNFGGLESVKPLEAFKKFLCKVVDTSEMSSNDTDSNAASLIRERFKNVHLESEDRYLLILTDNYAALNLLQHELLQMDDASIIFGSSFPKDQEYTQVCRNINRIKICMETGRTVVLLNLENLYESLYDALNQYYIKFGDQRFVDLGLGTQRVKCRVHKHFRLVVVAEKKIVYENFPIPLINRLEKHYLAMGALLDPEQIIISQKLIKWTQDFTSQEMYSHSHKKKHKLETADVFIGFHEDAPASLVLQACKHLQLDSQSNEDEILKHCQHLLLQCAVPESIFRLANTKMSDEKDVIYRTYFEKQKHSSIKDFIEEFIIKKDYSGSVFAQITTHSRLLLKVEIEKMFPSPPSVQLLSLQSFGTEQQFCRALKSFFSEPTTHDQVLLIQCDSGDRHADLIACTRFNISNEFSNCDISIDEKNLKHVLLIIQLPRIKGGCFIGFQGGKWMSYHIDDLQQNSCLFSLMSSKQNCTISSLFDLENLEKGARVSRSEDVEDEEKEEDENYNDEYEMGKIELNKLIENCIHAAAALLKSPSNGELLKSRKTKILEPLIKNLHAPIDDSQGTTFIDLLRVRLVNLLREKEETVQLHSTSWLANDVASFEAVCNSGTLSHSFVQYLEEKITPILGYILAYCDANFNMDLLETSSEWIRKLWIAMFNDVHVTLMKYSDIQTISHRSEVGHFDMKNFGPGSVLITGKLPFSWLIKGQLDKLILQFQLTPKWMGKDEADINKTFQLSGIGKLLSEISLGNCEVEKQIFDLYLNDFVSMVYKPVSQIPDQELQLVAKDLRASVLKHVSTLEPQYQNKDTNESCFSNLSKIHTTHYENRLRYKLFTEFSSCFPEGVQMLHEKISEIPDRMTLDYLALECCLGNLSFSNDCFKTDKDITTWTSKVKTVTPVIEHLLNHLQNTDCPLPLDDHQYSWNRICILQIFIDQMSSTVEFDVKTFTRLGMILNEKADLKKLKTFENIEKFLASLNKKAMEKHLKKDICCCVCKKLEASKLVSCSHIYCEECLEEIKEFHQNKCHECDKIIEKKSIKKIDLKKESLKIFEEFKKRTNSFLMSLVSEMCFAGDSPPEKDVIEKLLEYVVYTSRLNKEKVKTRNMELDSIDPTPVVRSFLLQLLLRYEMDSVKDYLEAFFERMCKTVKSGSDQVVELGALCQHCLEDHYSSLGSKHCELKDRLSNVMDAWRQHNVKNVLDVSSNINIELLQNTALLKWGLSELAEGLYRLHVAKDLDPSGKSIVKSLSDYTAAMFSRHELARIYLMKLLVHKYSWNVLLQLSTIPKCQGLINYKDAQDSKVLLDYFIVCGEGYKTMKKNLFQAILTKDQKQIKKDQKKNEYNFYLAVFQQFTLSYTSANLKIPDTDTWCDFVSNDLKISDKELVLQLIKNDFNCLPNINPNMMDEDRTLSELVFHYIVALKSSSIKNHLINPMLLLMENPDMMVKSYLPTMPHDEIYDVLKNLDATKNDKENTTFYMCPNKHLYVIGDCGRPFVAKKCPTCGSTIGGVSHQLAQGNSAFNLQTDTTQPGHILGQPQPSPPHSIREMSALQTSITRIFIHISLYIGSFSYDMSKEVIKPQIVSNDVQEFFWKHMKEDLKTIQTAINKNSDDVLIVLHEIIHNLFVKEIKSAKKLDWTSLSERREWEKEFAEVFISPYMQNMDSSVEKARKAILESENQVLCPLMKKIYELDDDEGGDGDSTDVPNYIKCQALWKFRVKISLENLLMNLQNLASGKAQKKDKKDHALLQYFLEKNFILKEIGRLPNIYALQCKLITKLNRCISASEAETVTISEFLNSLDDDEKKEFENLFQDFFHVWDVVRSDLSNIDFAFQNRAVPKEYLEATFNVNSQIGVSLPTMHGWGICSMAVINYLVHQQNQLLEVYGKETGTRTRQPIVLNDCTPAHFVSYHPTKDLNTLLLSNSTYSLKVGESTKISYDYNNLQKQIISRFLYGKPLLQIPKYFISFKEDLNVAVVFAELERKIPQRHANVVDMLGSDFRTLADVSWALACLNIVIEFIISVGQREDTNVVEFMTNTLKMKNSFSSFPSMSNLQFKHVKSAWLHLSLAKAKLQAKNGQSAFVNVDSKYKKIMTDEVFEKLNRCLYHVDVQFFAAILFECIVLQLTVAKQLSEDDDDGIDNSSHSLRDVLMEFLSFKNLEGSIDVIENGKFPEEILVCHCLDVWFSAADPARRHLIEH